MDAYKIGQFIKQLRTEKNLSQYQLADMIPITRQAVSKWERGVSVADSLTLIKLSEIFGVTVDELLTGERKNKDTSDKMKEVTLSMVDENISKGKKIKKIVIIDIIILVLLALLFLTYYFVNSYNSMKFYRVTGKSENFLQNKGILAVTKQKIYFQSGEIDFDDENIKINELNLYFKNGNKEKLIYSNKDSNILIIDHFGYNSYFKYEDIDKLIKNLYLEIVYNEDKKEKLHLKITNDFSNNNLLFSNFSTLLNDVIFKNSNAKLLPSKIIDDADSINKNDKVESKDNAKSEDGLKDKIEYKDKDANIKVFDQNESENKLEEKVESNKLEKYEKILYYLENKDLMIKMIKKNFKLDYSRNTPIYVYSYFKNNEKIVLNFMEEDNILNIYAEIDNKRYECYWRFDFDMIMLTIFENNKVADEIFILRSDIVNKNEKYQILADIIFKYFEKFIY